MKRHWRRARSVLCLAAGAVLVPGRAVAAAADPSPTADRLSGLYDGIFWAAIAVLAVVQVLIIGAAVRPRRSPPGDAAPDFDGVAGSRVEIAWTLAPIILLAAIAALSYRAVH